MSTGKNSPQGRKWQITINNPQEHGFDHPAIKAALEQFKGLLYYCLCDEEGDECQTLHTHVYFVLRSPCTAERVNNLFPQMHRERVSGTSAENRAYILKDGPKYNKQEDGTYSYTDSSGKDHKGVNYSATFEEWGTLPEEPGQGARTDIEELYKKIEAGMTNAEIMASNPDLAIHISRMDKIRQDILEARYRDQWRDLDVNYIFGPTATGKTRGVMEKHGYADVYRVTDYAHPFDRYAQEAVLCLDEFRSSLLIGDMLDYLDGYPLALPARYANRQACYETVYIISNIDLTEQYPNVQLNEPATWKAFLRRIGRVIEYRESGPPIDHGNALDYIFPPPTPQWVQDAEQSKDIEPLDQIELPY